MSLDHMQSRQPSIPDNIDGISTADAQSPPDSKRKRRPGITENACTECRKARAKCNGERPCSRCLGRVGLECVYETPARTAKHKMKLEIDHLKNQATQYDRVLRATASEEGANIVRQHVNRGEPLEHIAGALGLSSLAEREGAIESEPEDTYPADAESMVVETNSLSSSRSASLSNYTGSSRDKVASVEPWTKLTASQSLIEHLLTLYFCWEYPVFTILSEHYFRSDMKQGKHQYCSPVLVNAMCAVACNFSDRPQARAVPHDMGTAGDHFFKEAESLLARDSNPSLTSVQALGIMSLREASHGRDETHRSFASQCTRMAMQLGLHLPNHGFSGRSLPAAEREVCTITLWGVFALDQAWALCTGRIPQISRSAIRIAKIESFKTGAVKDWVPYIDDDVRFASAYEQSTNTCSVFVCYCGLSEIIHQTLGLLHSQREKISASKVMAIHAQYLQWYDAIPPALKRGEDFTPSVFVLHMYYQFALILLFRPFFNISFQESAVSPRAVCVECADNISSLMRSYANLYSMRRLSFIVPHIVLTATTIRLANVLDAAINEPVRQSLRLLKQTCSDKAFATSSVNLIKFVGSLCNIQSQDETGSSAWPADWESFIRF